MESDITVLVSSSPIKHHPSTEMIDFTLSTIRQRLPNSRIIIMQDGVRSEQQDYADRYSEYLKSMVKNHPDIDFVISVEHKHQARMTQDALKLVTTPLILFIEHDMPLCEEIPFKDMADMITSGEANVVRLMFEAHILEPHMYLTRGRVGDYTRTVQWSQRPHLANTQWYRDILDKYFSKESNTFIEDRLYGILETAPWEDFKVWIYTPDGDNKRSYTTDGRQDDPKYDDRLIY